MVDGRRAAVLFDHHRHRERGRKYIRRVQRERRLGMVAIIDTSNNHHKNDSKSNNSKSSLRILQKRRRLMAIHPPAPPPPQQQQRVMTRRAQMTTTPVEATDRHDDRGGGLATTNSFERPAASRNKLRKVKIAVEKEQENDETCDGSIDPAGAGVTTKTAIPHLIAATEDSSRTSPDEEEEEEEEGGEDSSKNSLSGEEENTSMVGRLIRRSLRLVTPLFRSDHSSSRRSSPSPPPKRRRLLNRDAATVNCVVASRRRRCVSRRVADDDERRHDSDQQITIIPGPSVADDDAFSTRHAPAAVRPVPVARRLHHGSTGLAAEEFDAKSRNDNAAESSDGEDEEEEFDPDDEEEEENEGDGDGRGTEAVDASRQTRYTSRNRGVGSVLKGENGFGRRIIARRRVTASCNQSNSDDEKGNELSAQRVEVASRITRSHTRGHPATPSNKKTEAAELSQNQMIRHHPRLNADHHKTFEEHFVAMSIEEGVVGFRITRTRQRALPISISPASAVENDAQETPSENRRPSRLADIDRETGSESHYAQNQRRSIRLFLQESPVRPHRNGDQERQAPAEDKARADTQAIRRLRNREQPDVRRSLSTKMTERSSRGKRSEELSSQRSSNERVRKAPGRLHGFVCRHHESPPQSRKRDRDQFEVPVAIPAGRSLRSTDTRLRQDDTSQASSAATGALKKRTEHSETSSHFEVESGRDAVEEDQDVVSKKKRGRPRKTAEPVVATIVVDGKRAVASLAFTRPRRSLQKSNDGIKEVLQKKGSRAREKKNRDGSKPCDEVPEKKSLRPRKTVAAAEQIDGPLCVATRPLRLDPPLDYTQLTDEYEALASDKIVKSIRFGPTFESACAAVERGIRHYETRASGMVDPDVLADEKLYRRSLKSHQSFEAQEKLNLLDDDGESIADDSEQEEKDTLTMMKALADTPIVWSDQVRIRLRGSRCKPDCRVCVQAARELCCVLPGTTTFTPGITTVEHDEEFALDDEIHTITLNTLKRLRHSLAFLDRDRCS
jgi:hypothetical protein